MSKVLQEKGFGSLPGSTETNPRDQVKSISTATADVSEIRRMEHGPYAVSGSQHRFMFLETVSFPRRLHNYCCDGLKEAHGANILDAYDDILPQKEKDLGSFTLPCLINNICFDKSLIDLGASVSVMPFSTYTNLGLGDLSHTGMTIELADRTIKQPKGIAPNVLVRIGKFVFPTDFVILDILEDNDVPLIIGRPFLFAQYLFRHAEGRKSGARLSGGHFIRRLAMHFRLVSDEGLRGLQATAGGAHDANEAGPAAEEVALEIPVPAPAPAQAPPPPPPAPQPRTMSQRIERIEEEVHDLWDDVVGLQGDVTIFTTEQPRVSTWLISCMTQLMDTSGQTYQYSEAPS
ncbi:retrotransposon protein [Tanacetum coccineum]